MAHSYGSQHIDKFRCDCAKCVPMSAAERKERQGEPAQDPRTWHHPVARGRRPLVVGRTFNGEKLSAFVQRHIAENTIEEHEEAGTEIDPEQDWYRIFAFEKTAPPGHDPDDPDVDEDGFIDDPVLRVTRDSINEDNFAVRIHRGVVLVLEAEYGTEKYAGRVSLVHSVFIEDPRWCWVDYYEVEIVGRQGDWTGRGKDWNWPPISLGWPPREKAIVSEAMVIKGAAAYKSEFYDHVRVNMMCLRKLVDAKRAAPPGYLLIKGQFVRPRRTSRATSSVDAKVVEKLFDRTTLPDECFKNVVSYMGSLEPRRPWRRYGRADFVKPAGEPLT